VLSLGISSLNLGRWPIRRLFFCAEWSASARRPRLPLQKSHSTELTVAPAVPQRRLVAYDCPSLR